MTRLLALIALSLCGLTAQERVSLDGEWTIDGKPITVPSAFETALGTNFDGEARYRCALPLPQPLPAAAARPNRVRIEFAAVATRVVVFCNGKHCGTHLGGWTPFRVDISDALTWDGSDVLEVLVDEKVGHNTQGFLPIIQPHFGGIWQSVTMCLDDGPVIDRLQTFVFARYRPIVWGNPRGELTFNIPVLNGTGASAEITLHDDGRDGVEFERKTATLAANDAFTGTIELDDVRPWSPADPQLYTARIRLLVDGKVVDRFERRVGFRALEAAGTRILWNGSPLQVRGILHWGYSPPHLAPPTSREFWRRQLVDFKSLGFNCIKCCLWVPPKCFYELCDELGMLVWQEYPTWHPTMDQAHKQELLTEYGEFFAHDRSHPSVAFRSITCETGQGADLDVVTALFNACKSACPDTLVVDDSSWIGWQRITDFWDEHPYGNNSWFPGRLEDFKKHIADKGEKPLLLGECIAADTWVDRAAYLAKHGDGDHWWRPWCWDSQIEAEKWLAQEFGQETVDSLLPWSLEFGMRNRKFQIEQLRLSIPNAGYVVSVARDFGKARMGLYDDKDELKWDAADWSWHRDTMLCLDRPWNGRAMPASAIAAPVRVSHFGQGTLEGTLRIRADHKKVKADAAVPIRLEPGETSEPIPFPVQLLTANVERVRVRAELEGSHPASNAWDVWVVPTWAYRGHTEVIEARELTTELLADIEGGARVLLRAGDRQGSPRTEGMWFLKGAPFAPTHPLHHVFPRDALLELSSFNLESGRVMPWGPWRDQVDPILGFWETHDIRDVRFHLHAFDTRIGKGRLLATTLNLEGELHSIGFHLRYQMKEHLTSGPAATRALTDETIAALRQKLSEKKLALPVWRFRTDPNDEGRTANWHDPTTDVLTDAWRDLKAGSHWENQGDDLKHFTGIGWYRVDVAIPDDWQGLDVRAVFEGVDDSFEFWLDGEPAGAFGDPATQTTIWLEQQTAELGPLTPGPHTLVLRVVDHQGAGGLWKPVFLTTGPSGKLSRLLH